MQNNTDSLLKTVCCLYKSSYLLTCPWSITNTVFSNLFTCSLPMNRFHSVSRSAWLARQPFMTLRQQLLQGLTVGSPRQQGQYSIFMRARMHPGVGLTCRYIGKKKKLRKSREEKEVFFFFKKKRQYDFLRLNDESQTVGQRIKQSSRILTHFNS